MKKGKIIMLLLVLFMPFIVNAETCDTSKVTISSIKLDNKTGGVTQLGEPTASGKNVNLNLAMTNEGDNAIYQIVVRNDSNDDYELDSNSLGLSSDYITYTLDAGTDPIIKANSTRTVNLRVNYAHQVPAKAFKSGSYTDSKDLALNLSSGSSILSNPKTGASYLFYILVISAVGVAIYKNTKKKKGSMLAILVLSVVVIPTSVYALCKCQIKVTSSVEIQQTGFTGVIYRNDTHELHEGDSIVGRYGWVAYDTVEDTEVYNSFTSKEECEEYISGGNLLDAMSDNTAPSILMSNEPVAVNLSNNSLVCKFTKVSPGEYVTDAKDLNKNYYIRDEVANDIITKAQVCLYTTKEVCFTPDDEDYDENISKLTGEVEWFESNGGSCTLDEEVSDKSCVSENLRADINGMYTMAGMNYQKYCTPYYCVNQRVGYAAVGAPN